MVKEGTQHPPLTSTCKDIYVYMHTHIEILLRMSMNTLTHIFTYMNRYAHHIHTCEHEYTQAHHIHIFTHVNIHPCTSAYEHAHIHV